jgi:hypothetical protein
MSGWMCIETVERDPARHTPGEMIVLLAAGAIQQPPLRARKRADD